MDNLVISGGGDASPISDKKQLLKLLGVTEMPDIMELDLVIAYNNGKEDDVVRLKLQARRGADEDGTPNVKCVMRLQSILTAIMQNTAKEIDTCPSMGSPLKAVQAVPVSEPLKKSKSANAVKPQRPARAQAKQKAVHRAAKQN